MSYNGWIIPDIYRSFLLEMRPPKYNNVKMSHITYQLDCDKTIPCDQIIKIIGYADNGTIEAFLVDVPDFERDGFFHITISHDDNSSSKDANNLNDFNHFEPIEIPVNGFFCHGDSPYITTLLSS